MFLIVIINTNLSKRKTKKISKHFLEGEAIKKKIENYF